jgi:Protein of unknown function (DUF2786)
MSERPTANIIERVRKILAKTQEAGCPQAEAETAFAMASRLLAEHNLCMDDVHVSGGEGEEKFTEESVIETGRWTNEHNLAYHLVKTYFFVEGFFGVRNGNKKPLYLFGTEANVATARHVFLSLLASTDRLWASYRVLHGRPGSEGRIFRVGVIKGFQDKLKEEREAQEMERDILSGNSNGTALAIRRIDELTAQKYREAHPQHGKARAGRFASLKGSQSTLQAGYEAGKALNLNRAVEGKAQKGIGRNG